MAAAVLKVEPEQETCCVCGVGNEELFSPEEHDASMPTAQVSLRAMMLHLNNNRVVPNGRFCVQCIRRTLDAYSLSTALSTAGPPPLSEKIQTLRKRTRSTANQLKRLTEYMAIHPQLARGEFTGPQARRREARQWEELRAMLSHHGPDKSIDQWKVTWRDLRRKARTEESTAAAVGMGNGTDAPFLSEQTKLILGVIGTEGSYRIPAGEESDIGSTPDLAGTQTLPSEEVYLLSCGGNETFDEVDGSSNATYEESLNETMQDSSQQQQGSPEPKARSSHFLEAELQNNNSLRDIAYQLSIANRHSAIRARLTYKERLHELTQKIDVFIVVGGGANGNYSEEDIIMVERDALQAASENGQPPRTALVRPELGYQCTVCPETFQRISLLREHLTTHGSVSVHNCWTCGAQFDTATAALDHSATHSLPDRTCHVCNTVFQTTLNLRQHEPTCTICIECQEQCSSREQLVSHMTTLHADRCDKCLAIVPAEERAAHRLAHARAQRFVCGYDACILRFATRNDLLAHIRKCHNDEPEPATETVPTSPQCTVCNRVFGSVAALKRHSKVHRFEKPVPAKTMDTIEYAEEDDSRVEYLEVETLEEMENDE